MDCIEMQHNIMIIAGVSCLIILALIIVMGVKSYRLNEEIRYHKKNKSWK